ncbi:FtsX-like permease family protein [Sinomicrobium weinanense]|uniref:ABC transporter permease n=1 Tax=Sinomicrobium weinanense TaxID=2842200 RepID=A0A926Q2K4_9FLAO|nr:FtsX-like permease family protein [Sinomicrobium weinanense]MBC9794755.1 ABC transporter permease [Sinomicrobium weinanense]MBU3125014.1 ABC transporter permease [Sinomicrobium weinanense]
MIKNYLKIAFRNLWNNRLFSLINVISLAIGLCASFVIGLAVYYDLTFDTFHPDGDRIFRITSDFISPEGKFYNSGVPRPLTATLKEGTPGVPHVSAFITADFLKVENRQARQSYKNPGEAIYADGNYFDIFKYDWLAGNPETALANPNELVLTGKRAGKYFPSLTPQQVIGQTLVYNDSVVVKVTGVVANFKERSDLIFEEFLSLQTATQSDMKDMVADTNWNNTNSASQLFIKTAENTDISDIQKRLDILAEQHEDKQLLEFGQKRRFHIQPLKDIHFNPNYGIFDYSTGQASKPVLIGLSCIAFFLLILGSINFINLNTAQATYRAREIGVRKTLGGSRQQLIFQFLTETFLLTCIAALISVLFSFWLLDTFSGFLADGVQFHLFANPLIIAFAFLLIVIVSLLSGYYPALVLSGFKPVTVLKNQIMPAGGTASFRKYLTVFQFVIAQVFIIATLLVGKQIHFLMSRDMGIKTDAIAFVRTPWHDASMDKRIRFMEEIKTIPQIQKVSLGGNPPASFNTHSMTTNYVGEKNEVHANLQLLYGDAKYMDLYDIELLAGRKLLNDTIREYIINETYMNILGFNSPEEALGKELIVDEDRSSIVGVMKDFNQRSLKSKIEPMALVGDWYRNRYSQFNTVHFSLQAAHTENWPDAMARIENTWKEIYPDSDFGPQFMDDTVKRFYRQESRISTLLNWATALSVLISCLGLLGLVIYTTERRTKEIGVRKVLGASLMQINFLLCAEFLLLIGLAYVIAVPIAWLSLNAWLQDFAYKTRMSWWVFLASGGCMLIIALMIMSIRTLSKARTNPVKSLRTE